MAIASVLLNVKLDFSWELCRSKNNLKCIAVAARVVAMNVPNQGPHVRLVAITHLCK
jgi:hypothetical protein